MSLFRTGLGLIASVVSVSALADPACQNVSIVTEEYPPFNYTEDGHEKGLATDVVLAVLRQMGMRADIRSLPWARAYDTAVNGKDVMIYSITRTPQREQLFKWVGVISPDDYNLFALKGKVASLRSLDDARSLQTATVIDDAGEQYLISKGFVPGKNLQSSIRYDLDYQKLKEGRVDLWIANRAVAVYLARKAGDRPEDVMHAVFNIRDLNASGAYMAFGTKTADDCVEKFRAALQAIKANGDYDALQQR